MSRSEEIHQILKHLLSETDKAIDNKQYSPNPKSVIDACKSVLIKSKLIEKYLQELDKLKN